MNSWPNALTPLQRQILAVLRPVSARFVLSGGAALSAFHLGHRRSADLDLFVTAPEDIRVVGAQIEMASRTEGWRTAIRQDAPSFRRYAAVDATGETTLVDIVVDTAPPVEAEKREVGGIRIDGIADLVVNKLCALLGRSSIKDLVDLFFLARSGVDPLHYVERAKTKDGGMDPAVLAHVLAQTPTDPRALDLLRDVAEGELRGFRDDLVDRLARLAWPGDAGR